MPPGFKLSLELISDNSTVTATFEGGVTLDGNTLTILGQQLTAAQALLPQFIVANRVDSAWVTNPLVTDTVPVSLVRPSIDISKLP